MRFSETLGINPQQQHVRLYFDRIANDYARRYTSGSIYHSYFFQGRLQEAVRGLDFEGKKILDIGAGTGALYDYLKKHCQSFEYTGTDISAAMLQESHIPVEYQRIGVFTDLELPSEYFDLIFMLGVTTYISRPDLESHLAAMKTRLTSEGIAILSFTHRCSLDLQLRQLFRSLNFSKLIKPIKSRLISQPFATMAYCKVDIKQMLNRQGFSIQRLEWLNQTVTPFNHLFPRASVGLASRLKRVLPIRVLPFFSGDLLVVVGKKR